MKIKPMGYRLAVKPVRAEEKIGSIYIPDDRKDQEKWRQCQGEVIDIGELAFTTGTPGQSDFYVYKHRPSIGDTIVFREYAGANLERLTGEDNPVTVLNDSDVIAIEVKE